MPCGDGVTHKVESTAHDNKWMNASRIYRLARNSAGWLRQLYPATSSVILSPEPRYPNVLCITLRIEIDQRGNCTLATLLTDSNAGNDRYPFWTNLGSNNIGNPDSPLGLLLFQ